MLTVRPGTLPGGLPVGAVSSYSLSLELVGSNDVCQRHHLVLVNGQEVLGDVLKEQGTRLVHAAGGVEPDTAPGAPLCATRRGTWSPDTCTRARAPLRTGTRPQSHHVGGAR